MSEGVHKIRDLRKELRQAFADYVYSEGCTCCQNTEKHDAAAARLGKLLRVTPYADGSGYDFTKYRSQSAKPGVET